MLPSGRTIDIDTMDFAMLNGGQGLAHINMNNSDNRVNNLKYVSESPKPAQCSWNFEDNSALKSSNRETGRI